jgi:hypothetical protein
LKDDLFGSGRNGIVGLVDLPLVVGAQLGWGNVDLNSVERARKPEGGLIKVAHRRSGIECGIEGFVRVAGFADFLVVGEHRGGATFSNATTVVRSNRCCPW